MSIEIKVPQLPESVADATLVTWHKQVGQTVSRDENLADLETDKVVLEVPAPVSGVLKELRIVAGTSVTSGQVLAVLEEGAAAAAPAKAAAAAAAPAAAKAGRCCRCHGRCRQRQRQARAFGAPHGRREAAGSLEDSGHRPRWPHHQG